MNFDKKKLEVNTDNELSNSNSLVVRANLRPELRDIYRDAASGERLDDLERCLEILENVDFKKLKTEELVAIKARLDVIIGEMNSFKGFTKFSAFNVLLGTVGLGLSVFNVGLIPINLVCMASNFYAVMRRTGRDFYKFKRSEGLRESYTEAANKYYNLIDKNLGLRIEAGEKSVTVAQKEEVKETSVEKVNPRDKMVAILSELQKKLGEFPKIKEVEYLEQIAGILNNFKMGQLNVSNVIVLLGEMNRKIDKELEEQKANDFKTSFDNLINDYMDSISEVQDKVASLKALMVKLIEVLDKNDAKRNAQVANGFAMCLWQTINCSSGREIIALVDCLDERFAGEVIAVGESLLDSISVGEISEFKQELLAKKNSLNGGTYLIELITILKSFGHTREGMTRGR